MTDHELRLAAQRAFDLGQEWELRWAMDELVARTPDDSKKRGRYRAELHRMVRLLERCGRRPGLDAPQRRPAWLPDAERVAKAVIPAADTNKNGRVRKHYVYAILLWGVRDLDDHTDRSFSIYVGSSVSNPETRLRRHAEGIKSSKYVEYFRVEDGLLPALFAHLNPLPSRHAAQLAEFELARALRRELSPWGVEVFGGAQELLEGEELPDPETPETLQSWLEGQGEIPRWLLRGAIIKLPKRGLRDIHAKSCQSHSYQTEAVKAIRHGSSGVVSLPTGAGKTRVAVEAMADQLSRNPNHLFLWISHPTVLIEQSLGSFLDWGDAFGGRRPRVCFLKKRQAKGDPTLFKTLSVAMMLRDTWVALMEATAIGSGPLISALNEGRQVTIIWDECHLMASDRQRAAWKKLDRVGVSSRFRLVGLSATPEPSSATAKRWMCDNLPPHSGEHWPFHHFCHRTLDELRKDHIISEIDYSVQRLGWFDIPVELLRHHRDELGDPSTRKELEKWTKQFNRRVMGDPEVLAFLARQLARNRARLGKTLVFVPSIAAANHLFHLLTKDEGVPRDMVSLAHSEMTQLGGLAAFSRHTQVAEQIARYKRLGSQAAIMITVTLLTTGFDDPRIQTVLLARLTMTKNLFWQMIGRGTRGPRAGGTPTCTVIDPIRLTQVFRYAAGYKPSLDIPEANEPTEPTPYADDSTCLPEGWKAPAFLLHALGEDARYVERGLRAFLRGDDLDSARIQELVAHYGLLVDESRPGKQDDVQQGHNAWASILAWYVHRAATKTSRPELFRLLELLRGVARDPVLVDRFLSILKRVVADELSVDEALDRTPPLKQRPDQAVSWDDIAEALQRCTADFVRASIEETIPELIEFLGSRGDLVAGGKVHYVRALTESGLSPVFALERLLVTAVGEQVRERAVGDLAEYLSTRIHSAGTRSGGWWLARLNTLLPPHWVRLPDGSGNLAIKGREGLHVARLHQKDEVCRVRVRSRTELKEPSPLQRVHSSVTSRNWFYRQWIVDDEATAFEAMEALRVEWMMPDRMLELKGSLPRGFNLCAALDDATWTQETRSMEPNKRARSDPAPKALDGRLELLDRSLAAMSDLHPTYRKVLEGLRTLIVDGRLEASLQLLDWGALTANGTVVAYWEEHHTGARVYFTIGNYGLHGHSPNQIVNILARSIQRL